MNKIESVPKDTLKDDLWDEYQRVLKIANSGGGKDKELADMTRHYVAMREKARFYPEAVEVDRLYNVLKEMCSE